MKVILAIAALMANSSSAIKPQFRCITDFQNNGNEMEGGRSRELARYFKWRKVPYFFTAGTRSGDKALIEKQMRLVEERTCVKFKRVSQHEAPDHHLMIQVLGEGSCRDGFGGGVGLTNQGMQVIFNSFYYLTDDPSCQGHPMHSAGVLHELMHVLGAMHTHKRMDRDKYIDYREECLANREPITLAQFAKTEPTFPSEGLVYELDSIMHYGCDTFGKCMLPSADPYCNCPTIKPRNGDCSQIGTKNQATQQDWKMINQYQCEGDTGTGTTDSNKITTDEPSCRYQNQYGDEWCNSAYGVCFWDSSYCEKTCYC